MNFANPHALWFLLVVPPALVVFFWWSERTRRKLMEQFIQSRLLPGLVKGISGSREKIRAGILVIAAACLILALARPNWGYQLEEARSRGLDIVVAIDTSRSMLAQDIAPNRLERAKLAALDLLALAKSDRLGLVAFAGSAFLQCPLTIDDSAFRHSLDALDVNTLPQGGTALAEAIEAALRAYKEGENHRALVLFSDGEDHESGALEAAKRAAEAGMRIFTIGIGSPEGEVLRIRRPNGQTDYVRDNAGNVVKSRLNESLLRQVAETANGFYLPLAGAKTMETLYENGLAPLPKTESQERWVKRARERYHWPLSIALVLLIAEMLYPERKLRAKSGIRLPRMIRSAGKAVTLLLVCPVVAFGSPAKALRDYKAGRYGEALDQYEETLSKKKDDPRLYFNAGAAAYRKEQYDRAADYFSQALKAQDLTLQQQAYYNLGNALFQLGERSADPAGKAKHWEESVRRFESSLKLSPEDVDARFNHEFVKRKLEELQRQQEQKQRDPKQQQQNDREKQQESGAQQHGDEQSSDQQQSEQPPDSHQQPGQEQRTSPQSDQPSASEQGQQQEQPQEQPSESDRHEETAGAGEQGTPSQMTQEQAQRLLQSAAGEERVLPIRPNPKESRPESQFKDW